VAHYLIEVGYTPESWSNQIETKDNVIDRLTPALKACGAKLECLYYAFGDVDVVGVIDFKTPEDAAGFALAVGSTGALRLYRTTPLLSVDQGIASLQKASKIRAAYSPPLSVTLPKERAATRR
jgi:uncharacterized protein with GYD domain